MKNIYILAPANTVTGGPELLHQLCYKLNIFGYSAYMAYVSDGAVKKQETPEPYIKYKVPVCEYIDDNEDNLVVFPELFLFTLSSIKKAKRTLWWMSVDNALGDEGDFMYAFSQNDIIHFSQSQYATDYLIENGVDEERIFWLCDYINSDFLHLKQVPDENKNDLVVYNPKKGFEKTEELIKTAGDRIKWLPLEGYTPAGVRNVFQTSKVYIDFGNHPGRDRIPREAAYCGCCIITNKKGSAGNDVDIPIDETFKIDYDTPSEIVVNTILSLIDNYSVEKFRFKKYNERTEEEFKLFETDVLSIFEKIIGQITCIQEDSVDTKSDELTDATNSIDIVIKNKILSCISESDYKKALTYVVKYRLMSLTEDTDFAIMEATVRSELNELNEAEFIAKKALDSAGNNYELTLLLAKIYLYMRTQESIQDCLKECANAIKMAKGTEDEEAVIAIANSYIQEIKNFL